MQAPRAVLDAAMRSLPGRARRPGGEPSAGIRRCLRDRADDVYITAFGLIVPNAVHEAIHPLPEIAGSLRR